MGRTSSKASAVELKSSWQEGKRKEEAKDVWNYLNQKVKTFHRSSVGCPLNSRSPSARTNAVHHSLHVGGIEAAKPFASKIPYTKVPGAIGGLTAHLLCLLLCRFDAAGNLAWQLGLSSMCTLADFLQPVLTLAHFTHKLTGFYMIAKLTAAIIQ